MNIGKIEKIKCIYTKGVSRKRVLGDKHTPYYPFLT